jgi:short-subunit dehydrogenase
LINNAGIKYASKTDEINLDICKELAQVNYFGTARLTQKMLPHIKDQGKIINIASGAGTAFISNSTGSV